MMTRAGIRLRILLALGLILQPFGSSFSLLKIPSAMASVPWMINYQGRLTNTSGDSVDGAFAMTFRLYDDATSGSEQWKEEQSVKIGRAHV